MKTILTLFLLLPFLLFSQEETDTTIVEVLDVEAEFPGGVSAMKNFLAKNVNYPEKSMWKGEQGRVFVEFVVEKDGSISQVKILKGAHRRLNKEAKRVVKIMPNWSPGEWKGNIVRTRCRIPINFALTD